MNETLFYLEPDEEITAIIDRLREADADAVRFVIPKGALVLQSLVSLKLLKREADRLKKAIALVTQDSVGLNLGEQANISVFAKPKDTKPVFAARADEPKKKTSTIVRDEPTESEEESDGQSIEHREIVLEEETADEDDELIDTTTEAEESPSGINVHRYDGSGGRQARGSGESTKAILRRATSSVALPISGLVQVIKPLIVVGFLGLAGYIAFVQLAPRATIQIAQATELLEQTVTVTGSTNIQTTDLDNATVPARSVKADVSAEKQAPATGKKQVGEKAAATLTLYNYWDANPQAVSAGTVFHAPDGTKFLATAAASIPGASTTLKEGKVVTTPGTATVTVQAENPGPDANGKTGTFTIPSLPQIRQDKIYGEPTAATTGGTAKEITIVTQTDIDNLKAAALVDLTEAGKKAVEEGRRGDRLLDGASHFTDTKEEFSHAVDAEAASFSVKLTATFEAMVFSDQEFNDAAVAVLKKTIVSGRTLVLKNTDEVTPTVRSFHAEDGLLTIEAKFTTRTALSLDTDQLLETITGSAVTDAEKTIRANPAVVDVKIEHRPRFMTTLPRRASQITVQIDYR